MPYQGDFYRGKKIVVTGGAGFVGSHVVEQLLSAGASVVVPLRPSSSAVPRNLSKVANRITIVPADHRNLDVMINIMKDADVVMHLAAMIGGVQFSSAHQASIFQGNLQPFLTVIEAARRAKARRFLVCSTACVYPADAIHPTPESEGFRGLPQVTNEGYGMAKRMQEYLGMKYVEEFGFDVRIARPFNCYGPRDDTDPATSHVIPALIRKIMVSEQTLDVWGDGTATRAFIYVDDFARGLLLAAEKGPIGEAVNIGPKDEISVKELCEALMEACGKQLRINWDTTKPTGQQRRGCDTRFAEKTIGFSAEVPLHTGLQKTVDWFKDELKAGRTTL